MGFGAEFNKDLVENMLLNAGALDDDPNYGMTVKYKGQEYKYSRNDMKRLSRAYKSMIDNDSDFHDKAYSSYTNSNFDKQMASKGLPSWSMWSQVEKYAAGGSLEDNYSNLSDENWKKINELWQKDWEYGLTDADATRKALGLAPVAYDEMYENTWLDRELKAKGLPPSKLLNGKLGQAYNSWIDNSETRNALLTDVTKTYLEHTEDSHTGMLADAFNKIDRETYTFEQAYQDTLAKPEWGSFVNEHQGKIKSLPDQYDKKYLIKDEHGDPVKDENGQNMYNTEAWETDYRAAIANNSKVYDDEFSITLDNAQEWYKENAVYVQAQIQTDRHFEAQGKQVSSIPADEYTEMYNDMLTGLSFNDGKPLTVEDFFQDYELTPEIRKAYQPIVDETNRLLKTEGYTAAYNYLQDTEKARKGSYNALLNNMSGALSKVEEKAFQMNFDNMKAKNPTLAAMITDGLVNGEENMNKTKTAYDAALATGNAQAIETARQDYAKASAEYYKTKAYVNAPESIWHYLEMSDEEFAAIAERDWNYWNDYNTNDSKRSNLSDSEFEKEYNEWYQNVSRYSDVESAYAALWSDADQGAAYREWYNAYQQKDEWEAAKKDRDDWNYWYENRTEEEKAQTAEDYKNAGNFQSELFLAKQYRDATKGYYDAIYWNQFDTDAELAYKLKSNISVPETEDRDERLKPFVGKEYDATAYDKEHGTSDSKYAALVNEYAFINGDATSDYNIESYAKAWEASKSPFSSSAKENRRSTEFLDKVCKAKGIKGNKEKEQYKDSMFLAYFMTDNERARFNSLYQNEGAAKADEYFEYLRNGPLANRAFGKINEIYGDAANAGRLGQEFVSVLTVPVNLVYGAVGPLDSLINGTDDTVTEQLRAGKWNSAQKMRGAIAEDRGEIEGFLYQSGMSMADSLAAMAMATALGGSGAASWVVKGAQWLGSAMLGGSAYNSAYDEALSRGLSADKARLTATGQGFNEMLFEYISMDKLVDIATGKGINIFKKAKPEFLAKMSSSKWGRFAMGAANLGVNSGVQGLVEGSEELFTSMANQAWDNAINKSMSEEAQRIIQLMDNGMSFEDAKMQAMGEFNEQLGNDLLGGMLSGFIMAGGAGVLNLATNSSKVDPYGVGRFFNEVNSISAVKVEDALKYAKDNVILDENKTVTLEGAQKVFNGLLEQGADHIVLSTVRNQLFQTNNTEANNYMDSVIRETRTRDYNALAGAVENYLKKNGADVSRFNARSIVDKYMSAMSDVVQKSDVALLQQNIDLMKRGFIGTVDALVNGNNGGVSAGATHIANWVASLSDADQAVVRGIAEKYVNTFKAAGLDGAQYSNYANMAAALVYATQQSDFLGNANTVFGLEASVLNEAVNNSLLDADAKKAIEFVDNVCQAISVFENAERNGFLDTMSNGMNSLAYCSSLMAQARNHMQNSPSNAVYRFINKFGCSESALSLLAVTNHFDELGAASQNFMRLLAMSKTGLVSFAEFKKASAEMNRANTELKNKQKSYDAQNAAVQAMVESASARAARYEAESNAVRTEVVVDENGNEALAPTADLANATADIDNEQIHTMSQLDIDIENGRRSLNSAQNDLNNAQTKFNEAKATYNDMLNRFCASYMQTLGAQIATMQAGDSLYQSEFDRMTAFAQNGTREDVNRIESIIKNAEKSAAHAFSAASGIDVEIIKFDRKFCEKHKVDGTKEACEIDGKLYINERFMDGSVGYIDQIIAHELGHVAEKSANYYDKFAAFARNYLEKRFGKEAVKATLDAWVADGMTQEQANKELVAEFCRNQMLSDPTAIITLCKKAPVMSVRVMQWLADTKSRLDGTGLRNSGIAKNVDRALRVYAKALKEAKVTISDMRTTALLENAREAIAQAQEFKEKQTESETKPAETKSAPAQTETQAQTEAPAQTETVAEEKTETEQPKKAKSLQEAFDEFMVWSDEALEKLVGQVEETLDEEDPGIDEAAVDEAVAESVEEELAQESVEESAEEAQQPTVFTKDENGNLVPFSIGDKESDVPFDDWGKFNEGERLYDKDGNPVGYLQDVHRFRDVKKVRPITKKGILELVEAVRDDNGIYGDEDVHISFYYDDGTYVDADDLNGKKYKKKGLVGIYYGDADQEASWGHGVNSRTGQSYDILVDEFDEDGNEKEGSANSQVYYEADAEYYVRHAETYNNLDDKGRYRTRRYTTRESALKPYNSNWQYGAQQQTEQTAAQPAEQLNETPQTEEVAETPANETPTLPFELTDEVKAEIEREVNREKAKAKNGLVEHWQNMSIMFGVKKAVNDLAQKLGVEVDPATVDAFAQQYMLPEQESQQVATPKQEVQKKQPQTRKISIDELRAISGLGSKTESAPKVVSVDAKGNKLSERQISFFDKSKTRNKSGKLLPVYHYTNEAFTEFQRKEASKGSARTHGDGYYVSTNEHEFEEFGKNKMVLYANITNPFEMNMTEAEANSVYDTYVAKFHPNDKFGTYKEHVISALQSSYKVMSYLKEFAEQNGIQVSDILKNHLGYDGVHDGSEWVAYDANQLKAVDNTNPTAESNDINYYTEANALREGISKLSNNERIAYGQPTITITKDGITVTRLMSANGFSTNNVTADGKRNIATIAKSDFFTNGKDTFFRQNLQMKDYKAVVIPNGEDYTTLRAQAREAGVNVITYDETKPHEFENAQRLANEADKVNYYPSKGNSFNDLIQKYGAIPEGMIPRRTDRQVPQKTKATNRVSRMARTIAEAPVTNDATYQRMPAWMEKGAGTYVPTSNKKTLEDARGIVSRSGSLKQAAAALHSDVSNGVGRNTDLLARAEVIFQAMQSDNTLTDLEREHVFSDLCIIASDSGRALQLSSELKRMTPEGHIDYIEQVGKREAERYHKRTGKHIDLSLTEEEKNAYRQATTKEQRDAIDAEVSKRIGELTSELTLAEKIRNWRYFSMLGNPRTHLRNIVGNTLMVPVTRIKDTIETLYQMGWDDADKTTTAFWTNVNDDVKDYVSKQLKENLPKMQGVSSKYVENIAKNADTQTKDITDMTIREMIKNAWDEENPSTRITNGRFKVGKGLNKLSAFNSNMLEVEDALFLGIRFKSSMYQQIQAKGIDVKNITEAQQRQIVDYAMEEALRATFRDASALADALNKLARSGKIANFAVEAILPFRKTPINIAKRGVEYSPIGLLLSGYKAISNQVSFNKQMQQIDALNITDEQKEAKRQQAIADFKKERLTQIDRLAAGTTGSIGYVFGMIAASLGWITIGRKDDDSSAFETALGKNNYSLNIGDVSIDLSAFSPAAISLLMGCATYQAIGARHEDDGTPIASTIINVLCESIDPITEMSFLSGFVDTVLSGNSYAKYSDGGNTKKLSTIGGQAIESFVGQFIPTVVGQLARVADTKDRSYSAGDEYWASKAFGSEVGSAVKSMQNKLPFLSWLSEPKVDLHGNESGKTNFGEWVLSFANNFILPATIKVDKKNEIDDELVRLYGVIDSADIFPTKPSRSVGQYQSQSLKIDDDKEYAEYQKEYGQTVYDMLEDLIYGGSYQYMTEAEKADAVEKVIDKAKSITKKRWKAKLIERIK